MDSITFTLNNIDHVAQQIVEMLDGRRTVCLYGPMGAGKTTLIRALCAALGVGDVVTSPTFALVNEYRRPSGAPIFHFDFYRVGSPHEVFDMGYEEYFYGNHGGLCLVEWPEVVAELLPTDDMLRIALHVNADGSRTIELGE